MEKGQVPGTECGWTRITPNVLQQRDAYGWQQSAAYCRTATGEGVACSQHKEDEQTVRLQTLTPTDLIITHRMSVLRCHAGGWLCKPEDLSLNSQYPSKRLGIVVHICNPNIMGLRQVDPQSQLASQLSPNDEFPLQRQILSQLLDRQLSLSCLTWLATPSLLHTSSLEVPAS